MHTRFEQFTSLILHITKSIRKIKTIEMNLHGLRSSHVSCLYYLYICGPLTAGSLCEKCEEDKSAISRALKTLEENGLVEVLSSKNSKYKNLLVLTEKGEEIGKQISDEILVILADLALVTTHEERVVFFDCLSKISKGLDEIIEKRLLELGQPSNLVIDEE